jgi:hypothetical protein
MRGPRRPGSAEAETGSSSGDSRPRSALFRGSRPGSAESTQPLEDAEPTWQERLTDKTLIPLLERNPRLLELHEKHMRRVGETDLPPPDDTMGRFWLEAVEGSLGLPSLINEAPPLPAAPPASAPAPAARAPSSIVLPSALPSRSDTPDTLGTPDAPTPPKPAVDLLSNAQDYSRASFRNRKIRAQDSKHQAHAPEPEAAPAPLHAHADEDASGNMVRAGDWVCPSCQAVVFASKLACLRCATPKPLPQDLISAAAPNRAISPARLSAGYAMQSGF